MYDNESERLSDVMLGEAVIELLNEQLPVTNASLLSKLQGFLIAGGEASREAAIRSAITEVATAIYLQPGVDNDCTDIPPGQERKKPSCLH